VGRTAFSWLAGNVALVIYLEDPHFAAHVLLLLLIHGVADADVRDRLWMDDRCGRRQRRSHARNQELRGAATNPDDQFPVQRLVIGTPKCQIQSFLGPEPALKLSLEVAPYVR